MKGSQRKNNTGPKAVGNRRHGYGPIFRNKIIGLLVYLLLTRKDLKIRLETSILIEEWTCGVSGGFHKAFVFRHDSDVKVTHLLLRLQLIK